MKTSRFSDSQILAILKQAEAVTPVPEICREQGISSATFYKWRLKKMYAEERLKAEIIKETLEKRPDAILITQDGASHVTD